MRKAESKPVSLAGAVRFVIDGYPVGHEFHGLDLKKDVFRVYRASRYTYPDTLLRRMREFRRRQVVCLSTWESLYKKVCQ